MAVFLQMRNTLNSSLVILSSYQSLRIQLTSLATSKVHMYLLSNYHFSSGLTRNHNSAESTLGTSLDEKHTRAQVDPFFCNKQNFDN